MSQGTVGMVLGLAGFLLGGFAVYTATDVRRDVDLITDAVELDNEMFGSTGEKLRELEDIQRTTNRNIKGIREQERELRAKVQELLARLEDAERELARRPRGTATGGGEDVDIGAGTGDAGTTDAEKARFAELREKVFDGTASADERTEFWHLARTGGALDAMIKSLETEAGGDASTQELFNLASAYSAKLLTVPNGPERGEWAMKAEGLYQRILESDPDNWQARYRLAFSWSQWPDFMNKRPAAIEQFEDLRRRQESRAPEPQHAGVYLGLSRLYVKQGDGKRAREVLAAGLERHPDTKTLREALDALPEE